MKIKIGDLVRVISCYNSPRLKGQIGLFLGKVSMFSIQLNKDLWYYQVCLEGRTFKLIKNDLEVINENKSNET